MIRQIYFEFKKNFMKPSIVAVILLFLFFDAFFIGSLYQEKSIICQLPINKKVYESFSEKYYGTITNEKVKELLSIYRPIKSEADSGIASTKYNPKSFTYNVYNDALFLRVYFVDPMEYAYKYKQNTEKIVKNAKDNMKFYYDHGNKYAYRQNALIAKLFSNRKVAELSYVEMYQYYLQHDVSIFFVLLICIYALVNVFVMEKETEMNLLLMTTEKGNQRTIGVKIASSVMFMIGISFIFWIADFLFFSIFFGGFSGAGSPIYAVEYFENSPLKMSLLQYRFLSMGLKTIGILVFGLLVLFLSCVCKRALIPFVGSVFIIGGCLYVYAKEITFLPDVLSLWNPICLLVNRRLFYNTEFINLGGMPVLKWCIALGTAILLGLLLAILIIKKSESTHIKN